MSISGVSLYLEKAKQCPKCREWALFLCTIIKGKKGVLGVKCHKCNYKAELQQVLKA